ncbi:MAG: family 78 glycoside hydrolase catalytic domain [Ferruginibacter sp.]
MVNLINKQFGIRGIAIKHALFFYFLLFTYYNINAQKLSISNLRCDYSRDPIGVDNIIPQLSWELSSPLRNTLQAGYRILVSDDSLQLEKNIADVWDSKEIRSGASIQVAYAGKPLISAKKYFWKVLVWDHNGFKSDFSKTASWQMGLLNSSDWNNSKWIAYDQLPDSNIIVPAIHGGGKKALGKRKDILPMFRKNFTVSKLMKQATMFICGLGQFELSINGTKTGDHFLDPGWTKYDKHALYVSFDVTNQLQSGMNTIGVMLGNGFYYVPSERYRKLTGAYGYPKMICRMIIEYADGSTDNIYSNGSWKTTASPVIFSSIYGGEDYDANLEQRNWNTKNFDDKNWNNVTIVTGPPMLNSQTAEPLKVMEVFTPVKSTKIKEGTWIYDMGQNASGIPQIKVKGKKGDTVKVITAELINEDGSANQKATGSPSYYQYILKGNTNETWQPRFTYYGFRYIQIENVRAVLESGNTTLPYINEVKALHTRNAADTSGSFSCSNDLFNKTETLIEWSVKSNMASVFTDCPHREKLGWLEEAHLVGASIKYRYDIATLCRKVIHDMMMAQTEEGLVPEIAPEFVKFEEPFRDSPEWGSNCILLPWYIYQWYGDKQTLVESYDMMKRYVAYLEKKSNNHILTQGLGDWYDLGPNSLGVSQLTTKGITATAFFYYDLSVLEKIARLLSKNDDQKKFTMLAAEVKTAFNKMFFNNDLKQYGSGSQASNAIAVYMNLVNPEDKDAVVENIVKDIRSRNNALSAGDIGYRYLLKVLDEAGRSDMIFDMNNRSDVAGYGYQLAKGATALTESWQALPTVSNNHLMLGHIMEWFYEGLAGISEAADAVGFNKIIIRPQVVGNITSAKATFHCPYGMISSNWTRSNDEFDIKVQIPANTTALVELPLFKKDAVLDEDGPKNTFRILKRSEKNIVIRIGSGNYHFTLK